MEYIQLPKSLTTVTKISKIMALILFVSLPFIGFLFGRSYQRNIDWVTIDSLLKQTLTTQKDVVYVSTNDMPQEKPLEGTLETYKSDSLGVSFSYFQLKNGTYVIKVKEVGNKIFLYTKDDYTKGKYIEVFNKDKNKILEEAIKSTVLQNSYSDKCTVTDFGKDIRYGTYSPNNVYARIEAVGIESTTNLSEILKLVSLCPAPYTHSNFVSYFVMDKNSPNKFAFVNLGQDNFRAYPDMTWDMTIRFAE